MKDCYIVADCCGLLVGVLAGAMVARVGHGRFVAVRRWIEMADRGRVLRWVLTHLDDGCWLMGEWWCWHAAAVDRMEEVLAELLSGVMAAAGMERASAAGGRGDGWDRRTVLIPLLDAVDRDKGGVMVVASPDLAVIGRHGLQSKWIRNQPVFAVIMHSLDRSSAPLPELSSPAAMAASLEG
ncbi:hypothetical protein ACLOJK_004551 [Asimina triloba]